MTLFRPRTSQKKGEGFERIEIREIGRNSDLDLPVTVSCGFPCVGFADNHCFRLFGVAQIRLTPLCPRRKRCRTLIRNVDNTARAGDSGGDSARRKVSRDSDEQRGCEHNARVY